MIIVRLNGGLGNQMFQYALGKHLAMLHNTELKLDTRWFKKDIRNYELSYLNIEDNIATEQEISSVTKMTTSLTNRLERNIIQPLLPYYKRSKLKEQALHFDKNVFKCKSNVYLEGYWQTEKYFLDIKKHILKTFTYKYELDGKNVEISKLINKTDSVSIHIRRGDYVSNTEYNQKYGTCRVEYYLKANQIMKERLENPFYFIFSDDPRWTEDNVKFFQPSLIISHNTGTNSYKDMLLMSICKHNIIANSSFSWWSAWLNRNHNKIVIAPEVWFKQQHLANTDIIPPGWLRI